MEIRSDVARTALCEAGMANDVVIATKWSPLSRIARKHSVHTIDKLVQCLSPCKMNFYQIHLPYAFSSVEAQMDAMAELVKAGKIRLRGRE